MQRMIVEQSKELEEVKNEFGNASNLMQEKYKTRVLSLNSTTRIIFIN